MVVQVATFVVTVWSPRDLTELRWRRQGERQKSNRFNEQNNNSARASRFFVHFFAVPAQILSVLENKKGEAINSTISVRTRARSPLL